MMNTHTKIFFSSLVIILALFVGQFAYACDIWTGVGCDYDTSGNLTDSSLADAGYPPAGYDPTPVTVTTTGGTSYSVDINGSITDSSGNIVGTVDINGNITLADGTQYGNVSGLGDISISGSSGSVTYGLSFDQTSTLSGTEMINLLITSAAYASELDSGSTNSALLSLLDESRNALKERATAGTITVSEQKALDFTTLTLYLNRKLSAGERLSYEARAAAEGLTLDEYIARLTREYGLYETSGNCATANCTYDSALGFLGGWFSNLQAAGISGSGSGVTPGVVTDPASLGGGSNGSGDGTADYSWICSFVDCTSDLWSQLLNGGSGGNGGNGSGNGSQVGPTRPDVKYEEF